MANNVLTKKQLKEMRESGVPLKLKSIKAKKGGDDSDAALVSALREIAARQIESMFHSATMTADAVVDLRKAVEDVNKRKLVKGFDMTGPDGKTYSVKLKY